MNRLRATIMENSGLEDTYYIYEADDPEPEGGAGNIVSTAPQDPPPPNDNVGEAPQETGGGDLNDIGSENEIVSQVLQSYQQKLQKAQNIEQFKITLQSMVKILNTKIAEYNQDQQQQ